MNKRTRSSAARGEASSEPSSSKQRIDILVRPIIVKIENDGSADVGRVKPEPCDGSAPPDVKPKIESDPEQAVKPEPEAPLLPEAEPEPELEPAALEAEAAELEQPRAVEPAAAATPPPPAEVALAEPTITELIPDFAIVLGTTVVNELLLQAASLSPAFNALLRPHVDRHAVLDFTSVVDNITQILESSESNREEIAESAWDESNEAIRVDIVGKIKKNTALQTKENALRALVQISRVFNNRSYRSNAQDGRLIQNSDNDLGREAMEVLQTMSAVVRSRLDPKLVRLLDSSFFDTFETRRRYGPQNRDVGRRIVAEAESDDGQESNPEDGLDEPIRAHEWRDLYTAEEEERERLIWGDAKSVEGPQREPPVPPERSDDEGSDQESEV